MFDDLLNLVQPSIDLKTGTFEEKRRRVGDTSLVRYHFCRTHNGLCDSFVEADLELSGLPCPDNSKANRKRMFQEGPTGPVYIAWAERHKRLKTPLLIIENVREFWLRLGHVYLTLPSFPEILFLTCFF